MSGLTLPPFSQDTLYNHRHPYGTKINPLCTNELILLVRKKSLAWSFVSGVTGYNFQNIFFISFSEDCFALLIISHAYGILLFALLSNATRVMASKATSDQISCYKNPIKTFGSCQKKCIVIWLKGIKLIGPKHAIWVPIASARSER